jgi:hypothetical protein
MYSFNTGVKLGLIPGSIIWQVHSYILGKLFNLSETQFPPLYNILT